MDKVDTKVEKVDTEIEKVDTKVEKVDVKVEGLTNTIITKHDLYDSVRSWAYKLLA